MPFKSEKQRRFLWAKHPDIAKRWAHEYPESNKNLPTYADDAEKKAALSALSQALASVSGALQHVNASPSIINDADTIIKNSADGLMYVKLPKKSGPSYAGEESEAGAELSKKPENAENPEDKALDEKNPVAQKLAVVLGPKLREVMEQQMAAEQGRNALPVPQNLGLKRYAVNPAAQVPPPGFGMAQPPAQPQAQPQQPNQGPVGGGSNPAANPINAYGPISQSGVINGNAAFGQKNSPDSMKAAGANTPCSCGCGDTVSTCKCGPDCKCRKPGGSCYKSEKQAGTPAWQRSAGKNPEGGLNAKGRASYKRETGGTLKAPVTESNPSGERAKRQNSFCSRMCGMKKHETGAETKSDPDSRINKSLRKWNCKCSSAFEFGQQVKEAAGWSDTLGNAAAGLGTSWNNAGRVWKGMMGSIGGGLGTAGAGLAAGGMQGANAIGGLFGAQPFSNEAIDTAYGVADHYANMGSEYGKDFAQGMGMGPQGLAGTVENNPSFGDQYVKHVQNLPGVTEADRRVSNVGLNTLDFTAKAAPAAAIGGTLQAANNVASGAPLMQGVSSFAPAAAPAAPAVQAASGVAKATQKITGVGSKLNSSSNPLGFGTSAGINAVRAYQTPSVPSMGKAGAAGASALIDIIEKRAYDPYRGMLQTQRGFLKAQQPYMQAANVLGPQVVSGAVGLASGNPLYKGVSRMATQGATQFMLNRLNSQIGKIDKQLKPGTPVMQKAGNEKRAMPRGLHEIPSGAGPDQISDAIMRYNQLRTLVRPTDETLRGHGLSRKGFQQALRGITAHSQDKDRFELSKIAPNPKLHAALAGLAGLAGTGALAYGGGVEGAAAGLLGTGIGAGAAYLNASNKRDNMLRTARLMKQYGLLNPQVLRQAYPLLGDDYRIA